MISDSNPEDDKRKNHSRPIIIIGLLGFSLPVQHGIISIFLLLLSPALPFAGAQSPETADPYKYARFSPSMAIIIVVLIAALFFMAFFSIYIRHCNDARNGNTVRPVTGVTGRSRRGTRGLDRAVIETFPTLVYSVVKGLKIGKGALECAVCLCEFEDDETLRLLPKCDHVFHPECIDAWLDSHTTCPVCRANLDPQPGDVPGGASVQLPESNNESDGEDNRSDIDDRGHEVSVHIVDDEEDQNRDVGVPEVINPSRSLNQNRPPRSRSVRSILFGKFPRSHSTGHSVVQPGENCERFTLRLPEEVRKQIVSGKLNRTTSCVVFPTQGSSRRGYRTGGEGSSRGGRNNRRFDRLDRVGKSDRWVLSLTRSFFSRSSSVRSPKVTTADGEGTSSTTPKGFVTSVMTPFDCLGAKGDGPGLLSADSARSPV